MTTRTDPSCSWSPESSQRSGRAGAGWLATASLAAALTAVGCAAERVDTGGAAVELTAEQCAFFAVNGRVTVCHQSNSPKHPYTVMNATVAACRQHVPHGGDYIGYQDPTCNGQGCFPAGAPYDGSVECCAGLTGASGTCQPIPCYGVVLDDNDACTVDACDPATDTAVHTVDPSLPGCTCGGDQCPLDPDKTAPGRCGCNHLEASTCGDPCDADSDADGFADCLDQCPEDPFVHDGVESCGPSCTVGSVDTQTVAADGTVTDGPDCIPDCMQIVTCSSCPTQT